MVGTWCGSAKPSDVIPSGKLMLVYFRSDALVEKRGFVCSYVSVYGEKKNGEFFIIICKCNTRSPIPMTSPECV